MLTVYFFCVFRCVANSQRSLGLGVQWALVRGLGTIPSSFIFGELMDLSCTHWNRQCSGDTGACIFYDNFKLSLYMVILTVLLKLFSSTFFALSWYFYQPPKLVEEVEETEIL